MIRAQRIWRLQRTSGTVAMVLLGLALLVLFDGLRGGIFGGSGQVRLIPGERYALSGPMPPKTERIEDFVVEGGAFDGSLRLVPEAVFKGYLFGGGMWRGHIEVSPVPRPGTYIFKVRDRFGEKQNPALVFTVRVFASAKARQAGSPSLVTRWTGADPFIVAAVLGVFGLATAGGNYLLGRKWHELLAEHGCGEIFRLRKIDGYLEAEVEMRSCSSVEEGAPFRFTHPLRGDLGQGTVLSCDRNEIRIRIPADSPVRLGDIACPVQA